MSIFSQLLRRLKEKQAQRGQQPSTVAQVSGAVLLLVAAAAAARRISSRGPKPPAQIALSTALRLLRDNSVQELLYSEGGSLLLQLKAGKAVDVRGSAAQGSWPGQVGVRYASQLVPGSEARVFAAADQAAVRTRFVPPATGISQVLSFFVPVIFLFVWYRIAKSLISREEKYVPKQGSRLAERTTFADVVSHSKVELSEIVDYLNHPEKYKKAGAKLPRGALLVGPSGTGKTLLARAVAGEANCRFLSASASEFVEVYVGRGAARVRDLFSQARSMAPVVLFLDELDALGTRSRGMSTRAGGGEEYVQTLNQLLTELDGFHGHSDGVVILGATNRQEAIDPSLLRPGRFDRHVKIDLPDEGERLEILRVHARHADILHDVQENTLKSVASSSAGFSGAELANVVNEAIFLALRSRREKPSCQDFTDSLARRKAARRMAEQDAEQSMATGLPHMHHMWPAAVVS